MIAGGDHGFGTATDETENNRFKATNKYVAETILTTQTDGRTDFERKSVVALATDGGTYLVDYDLDGEIVLRYSSATTVGGATWGQIKATLAE